MPQSAIETSVQVTQLPPERRVAALARILESLDESEASVYALGVRAVLNRLAACRRGEMKVIQLADVIAIYQPNTQQFAL